MIKHGRIIRVLSGFYTVYDGNEAIVCKARGKFRKDDQKPVVGDLCEFSYDGQNEGYLMRIFERKNQLSRPTIANIDQALIVVSAKEPDFSSLLLDRFLVLVEKEHIHPIIIVTKTDLLCSDDVTYQTIDDYRKAGYEVYTTANDDLHNDDLLALFKGKISVFTGQSGVGKSSLINRLNPGLDLKTGDISLALGRGRHTTRHVELFQLGQGWVADTPGFSSLELVMAPRELAVAFHDFEELSAKCKFRGCLHHHEPNCAVKEAVANGIISQERYQHYLQFLEEVQNQKGKY